MAIINDNDMEIILKGNQEETIRKMLKDRLFCLIKMPAKKPERITSPCSSSVFVGCLNGFPFRSFAIREDASKKLYSDCEYYLSICEKRETDKEMSGYFERGIERIKEHTISITYPTVDELLLFLKNQELVLITNYMHYGNFESFKAEDFLSEMLLLWKDSESKFFRREEFCDIRVYLSRVEEDGVYPEYGLYNEDVRSFDIRERIVNMLLRSCKEVYGDEMFYSVEYEAQSEGVQAAYFATRFHSNTCWDADPVNIVNARISAFVLPGTTSPRKAKKLPMKKMTQNKTSGSKYMIDCIHCNSDVFADMGEFKEYIYTYFAYFGMD
ncbi:MAG: hypothetical protein J5802_06500 [Butyrivibrio sp.]|nr:hypothetical protein [Butyrivibrio sp.]